MKKIILSIFIVGLSLLGFAQDQVLIDENFDTFIPSGWDVSTDPNEASANTWTASGFLTSESLVTAAFSDTLISPTINVDGDQSYLVELDFMQEILAAGANDLELLVSLDNGTTWEAVNLWQKSVSVPVPTDLSWYIDQTSAVVTGLTAAANQNIKFAIVVSAGLNTEITLALDNMQVYVDSLGEDLLAPTGYELYKNYNFETGLSTWTNAATNNGNNWIHEKQTKVAADIDFTQDVYLSTQEVYVPNVMNTTFTVSFNYYSLINANGSSGLRLYLATKSGSWTPVEISDINYSGTANGTYESFSTTIVPPADFAYGDSLRFILGFTTSGLGTADIYVDNVMFDIDFNEANVQNEWEFLDINPLVLNADESIVYPALAKYDSTIAEGFWNARPMGWALDTVGNEGAIYRETAGNRESYVAFIADPDSDDKDAMSVSLTSDVISVTVPPVGADFMLNFEWATEHVLNAGTETDSSFIASPGATFDFADFQVQIKVGAGAFQTIWGEDDQDAIGESASTLARAAVNAPFGNATEAWAGYDFNNSTAVWYSTSLDISSYLQASASIQIRFVYTTIDAQAGDFYLDNFYVLQTQNPEFEYTGTLPLSVDKVNTSYVIDYTSIPITQLSDPMNFGAVIHNFGLTSFTAGQLDISVDFNGNGAQAVGYTPVTSAQISGDVTEFFEITNFSNSFPGGYPLALGSYDVSYSLSANGGAITPVSGPKSFDVVEEYYDKVGFDGNDPYNVSEDDDLEINDGTSGSVGSVFEFAKEDVVTTVMAGLEATNQTEAYLTIIKLANPNSTSGTKVFTSNRVVIEATGGYDWYEFTVDFKLEDSSFYAFMINQVDNEEVYILLNGDIAGEQEAMVIRGNASALYYDATDMNIGLIVGIEPNEAPEILTEFPNDKLVVAAGDSVVIEIFAKDANIGDDATLSWVTLPNPTWLASWMTFIDKGDTLIITGKPTNDDLGTCNLDVTVADTKNGSVSYNFNIEVVSDLAYFQPYYQADFRQFTQDDDLLLTGNSEPWSRSQFQATIDGASDKQKEWLISVPILIPAAAKATGKSYDLEFDWLLGGSSDDSKYFIGGIAGALGTEDVNGGANYVDVSLMVSTDNGSTWGTPIWKEDDPTLLAPVTEGIYQGEKWGYEGDQTYTSIINLDAYQGQVVMFAFVYESKNALTGGENYFEITNFEIYSNDEVDVDIYLHTDLTSVPTQHMDWTAGLSYDIQLINRGQSIPEGSLYSLSFPIQGIYEEFAINNATFASSDTVIVAVPFTFVPDSGLVNQAYTLTATLEVDNNVGNAADAKTITVADNVLNKDKSADVSEYTLAQYDGLGTVYQLLTDDYLEEIDVEFASAGADFSVTIIQLAKADTTAGKLIATINDDGGAQFTTNNGSMTIVVEDDDDFEKPLMLKAGYYAVMFNQLVDGDQIDIWRSDRDQDMLGFVRGNMNMLYNEVDDKGFLDMALNFKANEAPEFTTLSIEDEEVFQGDSLLRSILVKNLNTYGDIFIEGVDIPQWLLFVDNGDGTASLEGSAADAVPGKYTVSLRAHNRFMITNEEFEITVLPNPLPVFTTVPPSVAFENAPFSYAALASDELMEDVTLAAELLPTWLTATFVNDSLKLSGTPLTANVGSNVVKLSATDIYGNVSHQTFDLFVYANEVPVFVTAPVTASSVDLAYTYYVVASDANGNSDLVISADSATLAIDWLTFTDLGNGKATLVGTPIAVGADTVTLTVTDPAGAAAVQSFVLVRNSNGAPTFIGEPETAATEDVLYRYEVKATDSDGDYLYFTTIDIPNWLTFTATGKNSAGNYTAVLQGIPLQSSEGDTLVSLLVGDGNNTTIQSFNIVLTMVNDAPAIISTVVESAIVGEEYSYSVEAYDEEGAELVFNAQLPSWLSITESFGGIATISGTPTVNDLGKAAVVVNVTDGNSQAEQAFEVSVSNVLGVIGNNSLVVELYPNPTTGLFTLKNAEGADVTVISSTGQVVKQISKASKEERVNISELRAGTYFVKIVTNDQVVTKSFNLIK